MKKYNFGILLMTFVIMLTMVSCQKDTVSIKARISTFGNAKTYMGGSHMRTPLWNADDEVWVNGASYGVSNSGSSATTIEGVSRTGDYRAIYPASFVTGSNDQNSSNIEITLPAEQAYRAIGGNQVVQAPMGAWTSNSNNPSLTFTNMGAVLAIELVNGTTQQRSANLTIDNITVTSLNPNVALWGQGVVENINSDNRRYNITETLSGQSDDEHLSVTLANVNVQLSSSSTTPKTFYIYIPASTGDYLNNFKITVAAHSTSGTFVYTRSQSEAGLGNVYLNEMAYFPLDLASAEESFTANEIPEGAIDALFSVAEGVQVRFSQGNLRYIVGDGVFKFASNQYEIVGDVYNTGVLPEEYELFGWGTSGYHNSNDPLVTNYLPTSTSTTSSSSITNNPTGYGPSINNPDGVDLASNYNYDWGSQVGSSGTWRTLTYNEWDYLLSRPNGYKKVKVYDNNNRVIAQGLAIFPDNFTGQNSLYRDIDNNGFTYDGNNFYECYMDDLEENHIVFLSSAGYRTGTRFTAGFNYWTASIPTTASKNKTALYLKLVAQAATYNSANTRTMGYAVRLVSDVD